MARYIDADKFIERLKASPAFLNMGMDGYFLLDVVENLLKNFPTADVAPKSEVAREIFEEIAKQVASKIPMKIQPIFKDDMDFDGGFINGKSDALLDVLVLIAELKKKYTEEKE